ncbi:hypothetical protein ERJ75_001674500 [Trypanosoma vivax]|nr:hypothetical protein ERJ75_001674500 [Trypanosoma vivax]
MVCAWRSAVLLLAAALCLGVCPARGAATRTVSDSDPEDGAPQWECWWLSAWLGALRELKSLNKFYVLYFQDIQSVYRAYVTMLSDDEEVRNRKDVRRTRAAVQHIVDEVRASGGRLGEVFKTFYDVLVLWHKQFMHDHGPDAGKCKLPRHEGNLSRDAGFADRLDALRDETDELLRVSEQHGVRYYDRYTERLHELYHFAREEDEFFTLRKQMREATRSVRKAQAAAEKQKHELGDRVLVGCEVERKLSVVREIFLALRHVAADVVNREAALQERVAALRNSNAAPETLVAVTDTRDTQRMAEQAEREARAAYNDLMLFIRGGNQSALHDQLGYSEEIAVGREKCVDDIQDEQALLRDAAMRGQYSFRKFEDWKASVESLWSKVKNVDSIVQPHCHEWKGVKCDELVSQIREIVDRSDQVRAKVEDELTGAIKSLVAAESAVRAAEAAAAGAKDGASPDSDVPRDDDDEEAEWDFHSDAAYEDVMGGGEEGKPAESGSGGQVTSGSKAPIAIVLPIVAAVLLAVAAAVVYIVMRRRAPDDKGVEMT